MTKDEAKEISSFLLTAHIFGNQIALQRLNDFKEHIKNNDKALYHALRTQINQAIKVQQAFHDTYKIAIGDYQTIDFYSMMDKLNEAFDKTILAK